MTTVLVADDEAHIRILAEAIFKEMGYTVVLAVDGEDAVEKAKGLKPDLIVTDVIMPHMNGFEVCKTVRNSEDISDTPIIILSAMGDEYNKITGFEEGADDYITKPFNVEELKVRVKSLMLRYQKPSDSSQTNHRTKSQTGSSSVSHLDIISTGIPALDTQLSGGFPIGSNILVLGSIGRGKSTFSRHFMADGINNSERCLFVAVDDDPSQIRKQISTFINDDTHELSRENLMHVVDAYSWSSLSPSEDERFAVRGMLDLNQLSGAISDASLSLGQSVQNKMGGRRVLDSISSLLIHFELPAVQRFLSQIARTAVAFGNVTTLFVMEDGTVSDQVLNNIKYLMDGIVEFDEFDGHRHVRISSMKWAPYDNTWVKLS